MVYHTLVLIFLHVLINFLCEFWDILRISEVKFIWQGHALHYFLFPSLHSLPIYLLDRAFLNETAPFFGEFGLRRILASCLSFSIDRRNSMSEGALIMNITLILWLFTAYIGVIVIRRVTHLFFIIKVAKIMLILFGLLRISLNLANILLWTNWLWTKVINLWSGRIHKACHLWYLEDLRCVLDSISNTVGRCCMFTSHSLWSDTITSFMNHSWIWCRVFHLVSLIVVIHHYPWLFWSLVVATATSL